MIRQACRKGLRQSSVKGPFLYQGIYDTMGDMRICKPYDVPEKEKAIMYYSIWDTISFIGMDKRFYSLLQSCRQNFSENFVINIEESNWSLIFIVEAISWLRQKGKNPPSSWAGVAHQNARNQTQRWRDVLEEGGKKVDKILQWDRQDMGFYLWKEISKQSQIQIQKRARTCHDIHHLRA